MNIKYSDFQYTVVKNKDCKQQEGEYDYVDDIIPNNFVGMKYEDDVTLT